MPRARNIKPGFFTNDELAEIEPLGRLLFIGLWTIADREGRLEDRPKKIKGELFPYDDCDVNKLLQDLHDHEFIIRYTVDNKNYIEICNFAKHQNPHPKEAKSEIPPPLKTEEISHLRNLTDEQVKSNLITRQSHEKKVTSHEKVSTSNADSLQSDSLQSDSLQSFNPSIPIHHSSSDGGMDNAFVDNVYPLGNADEETAATLSQNDAQALELSAAKQDQQFMAFWDTYPKKSGMLEAYVEWQKLIGEGIKASELIMAAGKYAFACRTEGKTVQFIKYLPNFLAHGTYKEYLPRNKPDCPHCRGIGWIEGEEPDGYGGTKMVMIQCECRRELSA